MESSDNYSLCILCCYSVPFNSFHEQSNRQSIDKFIHQTGINTISSSYDLLEDGQLSICENCLFTINQAVDKSGQVKEVEVQVRNLQEEILRLLRQLQGLLDSYLEGMKSLEGTIKNSDESCLRSKLGWNRERLKTAENVFQFRHGIINVVDELGRFREDFNSKLVHNPSADLTSEILKTEQINIELCEYTELNWEDANDLGEDNESDPLGDHTELPGYSREQKPATDNSNDASLKPIRRSFRKAKKKIYSEMSDGEDCINDHDDDFVPGSIPKEDFEEEDPLSDSNEQMHKKLAKIPKTKSRISSSKKRYNCPDCEREFTNGVSLKAHTASQHSNLRPFQCSQCSKTFKTLSNLRSHQETHRNNKDNPQFKCGLCPKAFTNKEAMKKHINTFISKNALIRYLEASSNAGKHNITFLSS